MIIQEERNLYQSMSQEKLDIVFLEACEDNDLEIVQYLLSAPELKIHANIHTKEDSGFIGACINGNINLVKYLLSYPDLREHADINAQNDEAFFMACIYKQIEVLEYLIIDKNIAVSDRLDNLLKTTHTQTV